MAIAEEDGASCRVVKLSGSDKVSVSDEGGVLAEVVEEPHFLISFQAISSDQPPEQLRTRVFSHV
jgi:hypothetical protein